MSIENFKFCQALEGIVGASNVSGTMRLHGVEMAAVCTPETEPQAAEIIRFAASNKIAVVPYGSGTGQCIGYPPPRDSLVLSTRKLATLIQHEPADMVATAQAGMQLADFQSALATRGQWLPLDGPPNATLGGLAATDRSGACAHGYGTLRDMVLGMKVINGDGVLRKCGGKVVKNVTGYAMEKLYIGSLGTLGLITEITFKLRPLPGNRDGWHIAVMDLRHGVESMRKIAALNLPLEMIQLLSTQAAAALFTRLEVSAPLHLLVSAAGTAVELDRIDGEINAVASASRFQWRTLDFLYVQPDTEGQALVRFWCVPSRLGQTLELLLSGLSENGAWLTGITGGACVLRLAPARTKELTEGLTRLGVNFRFDDAQGFSIEAPFGPPRPEAALMKRIKTALDPQGILNPGR